MPGFWSKMGVPLCYKVLNWYFDFVNNCCWFMVLNLSIKNGCLFVLFIM